MYNLTQIVYNFTQVVYIFTQQLVGSYVSQCCVNFLNSGVTVYNIFNWIYLFSIRILYANTIWTLVMNIMVTSTERTEMGADDKASSKNLVHDMMHNEEFKH